MYELLSVVVLVVGMIILVIVYGGCHNEIATAFSKPRNDSVGMVAFAMTVLSLSLRGVKRRSNP